MEEEEVLERRLAELHLVDAQRRRVEADATMAVVAAQNRALQNNGFSSDDLGLSDEGNDYLSSILISRYKFQPCQRFSSCVLPFRSVSVPP